jgi:hypothetical protein
MPVSAKDRQWSLPKTLLALGLTIASYGLYRLAFQFVEGAEVHSFRDRLGEAQYACSLILGAAAILTCVGGIRRAKTSARWLFMIPILFVAVTLFADFNMLRGLLLSK